MKKYTIAALLCCLLIGINLPSFAQTTMTDSSSSGPVKTKMVTFSGGYAMLDVAALNQFLALSSTSNGFSQNFGILGLESTTECKRFIYGMTLQAGMSQKKTITNYAGNAGQNIDYYATYGNFLLHSGYSIVSTDKVKFYPIIGAGFGNVNANYKKIDNESITQFASNPNVRGSVGKYMACFDAALCLNLLMPSKRFNKEGSSTSYGRVLGLRVGYTQGVGTGNWRFDGGRILQNPTYNPGMVYAKLQIGIFRKGSRNCGMGGCKR